LHRGELQRYIATMHKWLAAQENVANAIETVLDTFHDAQALSVDVLTEDARSTLASRVSRVPTHARPYVERAKTVHDVRALLEEAWEGVEYFKELLARGLAAEAALNSPAGAHFQTGKGERARAAKAVAAELPRARIQAGVHWPESSRVPPLESGAFGARSPPGCKRAEPVDAASGDGDGDDGTDDDDMALEEDLQDLALEEEEAEVPPGDEDRDEDEQDDTNAAAADNLPDGGLRTVREWGAPVEQRVIDSIRRIAENGRNVVHCFLVGPPRRWDARRGITQCVYGERMLKLLDNERLGEDVLNAYLAHLVQSQEPDTPWCSMDTGFVESLLLIEDMSKLDAQSHIFRHTRCVRVAHGAQARPRCSR